VNNEDMRGVLLHRIADGRGRDPARKGVGVVNSHEAMMQI
jgi:hypothetical protein